MQCEVEVVEGNVELDANFPAHRFRGNDIDTEGRMKQDAKLGAGKFARSVRQDDLQANACSGKGNDIVALNARLVERLSGSVAD